MSEPAALPPLRPPCSCGPRRQPCEVCRAWSRTPGQHEPRHTTCTPRHGLLGGYRSRASQIRSRLPREEALLAVYRARTEGDPHELSKTRKRQYERVIHLRRSLENLAQKIAAIEAEQEEANDAIAR